LAIGLPGNNRICGFVFLAGSGGIICSADDNKEFPRISGHEDSTTRKHPQNEKRISPGAFSPGYKNFGDSRKWARFIECGLIDGVSWIHGPGHQPHVALCEGPVLLRRQMEKHGGNRSIIGSKDRLVAARSD